ncbi:MAG: ABC transporter ATP-binding protein [Pseudomonadales bacterium]|nr:ABC transporter ATP-binding protein [Pseudomonadales bacterium]
MVDVVVSAHDISKKFKNHQALRQVNLTIEKGSIVGLIGPNGAGKTTLLKSIQGLLKCEGELEVLGVNPYQQRNLIFQDVCFISDVGVLPQWATCRQLLQLTRNLHPKFDMDKAMDFLEHTAIPLKEKVKNLSKGMKAQLHLAIVLSMDVELMILDEPTLGLDIIHRKKFLQQLVGECFDKSKTIIVSTHQVEEIEEILTHLIFIQEGGIKLNMPMALFRDQFYEVEMSDNQLQNAQECHPISTRKILGKTLLMFEGQDKESLERFGPVHSPSIADVFIAKMGQQ